MKMHVQCNLESGVKSGKMEFQKSIEKNCIVYATSSNAKSYIKKEKKKKKCNSYNHCLIVIICCSFSPSEMPLKFYLFQLMPRTQF